MDDKKNFIPKDTKDVKAMTDGVIELVEIQDIRDALNKIDEKKAQMNMKQNQNLDDTIAKDNSVQVKDDASSDQKEEKQDGKDESALDKKDSENQDCDNTKKENKKEDVNTSKEDNKKDIKEDEKENNDITEHKDTSKENKTENVENLETNKEDNVESDKKENDVYVTQTEKPKSKKGIGIFFGVVLGLFLIVYIAGFVYFSNYFYPDVTVNGINVSNMNKEAAKMTVDNFNKNYVLTLITIDDKEVIINGKDIEMSIVLQDEFDDCLSKQKPYVWFLNVMNHHEFMIQANATWNQDTLDKIYKDTKMLDKKLMIAPKDAYIGIADGEFAIIPEELGTTVHEDKFKEIVQTNLQNVVANVNLKDSGCYDLPNVYSTDEKLINEFELKSEFIGGVISIQLDDLTLEPGMDLYDAVLEKKGDSYSISQTKVNAYVRDLAAEYDTMGKERNFTSSFGNGRVVKVSGTAFGYEMDQEATAKALYAALNAKKSATVEAVFISKGYSLQGENDIGDTFIEVNLSEQKVIAYKNGNKIVEGDCVSGCEANGNGTCLGLYKIQDKLSPTVLRGQQKPVTKKVTKKNKKGKKVTVEQTKMEYEYESPVTYWLQFNGGYGLHDAAGWRSVYGGSIYYYNGSHGCVNLPYDVAEKLYKNFELGDPVVVYFWDNENRK